MSSNGLPDDYVHRAPIREVTTATLSHYSQHHLNETMAIPRPPVVQCVHKSMLASLQESMKLLRIDASRSLSRSGKALKVLSKDNKQSTLIKLKAGNVDAFLDIETKLNHMKYTPRPLTKFTLFNNLPEELQNEIWKIFIANQPRRTTLPHSLLNRAMKPGDGPLVISQINRKLRHQPLAAFGYVSFFTLHPAVRPVPAFNHGGFVLHPKIDLLYIPLNCGSANRFRYLFENVNAIKQVRSIALEITNEGPAAPVHHFVVNGMKDWSSLELILLIFGDKDVRRASSLGEEEAREAGMREFRLERLDPHLDMFPSNHQDSLLILLGILKKKFAREDGVVPLIQPVYKIWQ